jgi:chemotaxis protein CheX
MKVEFINPFLNATINVIQTMAATKVQPGKPELKTGNLSWGVVSGIIGMASEELQGHMVISFDAPCILGIVSGMLGEEMKKVDQDVADAVGEITNMICGGAKKELSEMGYRFDTAIPLMIMGKDVEISQLSKGPVLTIPFTTEKGKFVVEANLMPRVKAR